MTISDKHVATYLRALSRAQRTGFMLDRDKNYISTRIQNQLYIQLNEKGSFEFGFIFTPLNCGHTFIESFVGRKNKELFFHCLSERFKSSYVVVHVDAKSNIALFDEFAQRVEKYPNSMQGLIKDEKYWLLYEVTGQVA